MGSDARDTAVRVRSSVAEIPVCISVVIVTFRRKDLLGEALDSVREALARIPDRCEVVVVDNGSGDGTTEFLERDWPNVHVITVDTNEGFTRAVTRGLDRASGEWIALLNDDVLLEPTALEHLLGVAGASPRVGSVAAQMRFADRRGVVNSAGIEVDRLGIATDRLLGRPVAEAGADPVEVFGACGGAALYRRSMLEELGGFDQTFFAYLEDVDLAWRARMKGWQCLFVPAAVAYHHHSATLIHRSSQKYFLVGRNRVRLLAKNASRRQLLLYSLPMLVYDLGYVSYALAADRSLAPLRGRLAGLMEWRRYRRAGNAERGPVGLAPVKGLAAALRRNRAWSGPGPQ